MPDLKQIKNIYFLGIGGIGMSALARYFKMEGKKISGYDLSPTPLTEELINEGIDVHYEESVKHIPADTDLVIYTPAIPPGNTEYQYFLHSGIPMKKRSEILGKLSDNMFTIAIAGTHGKTTITSMTTHILYSAGIKINAFVGGIMKNYDSNMIRCNHADIFVAEADEYDRSFLNLKPDIALISAIDPDHLDIYGSFEKLVEGFISFTGKIKKNGTLFTEKKVSIPQPEKIHCYSYGESSSDFSADQIKIADGRYQFTLKLKNESVNISLGVPGRFNINNATAAAAVCYLAGLKPEQIKKGLESFQGVKRRMECLFQDKNITYIDDYAHHPDEIAACFSAIRELYPEKKLSVVFQPHLYSRTRDLADAFVSILQQADEIILLEIYPAREKAINGINSKMLLDKIENTSKALMNIPQLYKHLESGHLEILLTIGAGDIDKTTGPITEILRKRTLHE